ncbi:MAG: methyltransferase domain-containing protein [Neomegalonema sp.]|nr:methyltransferase domain-containing protein [Neomegalonema sp.]
MTTHRSGEGGQRRGGSRPSGSRPSGSRGQGPSRSGGGQGTKPGGRGAKPGIGRLPRRAALKVLDAVLTERRFVSEAGGISDSLSPRDAALAEALVQTTLRHLPSIDATINARLKQPIDQSAPGVMMALRVACAELLYLRTPPHAAVDNAVALARESNPRLAGLANAVCRRIAEAGKAPDPDLDTAWADTPGWLRKRLKADWPEQAGQIALAHAYGATVDLTLKDEAAGFAQPELSEEEPPHQDLAERELAQAEPSEMDAPPSQMPKTDRLPSGSYRLREGGSIADLSGYEQGLWWVQDAAAAMPVQMLGDINGAQVLDLCAAPGGKTMQLAARGAQVTALDRAEKRLKRLSQNLTRTGLSAQIVCADALDWQPEALFDALLLDAPCSASGTIRRHPELPHIRDGGDLGKLVGLQARLLDAAWGMLRPGGVLVYCVCSLFREEGEAQAQAFLSRHDDASTQAAAALPQDLISPEGWLRSLPCDWIEMGGLDGFFAAALRKSL